MSSNTPAIHNLIHDLIEREGGYTHDPYDSGGPTKYGITIHTLAAYRNKPVEDLLPEAVERLTKEDAYNIYFQEYLIKPKIDQIQSPDLRELVFDCGVLHGTGIAIEWLQIAADARPIDGIIGPITLRAIKGMITPRRLILRITKLRLDYIADITVNRPSQLRFLRGWQNRAMSFLSEEMLFEE